MSYTNPTITDFKNYFDRDFQYGATDLTVKDSDITKALNQSSLRIFGGFESQDAYTEGFLLLMAHSLVMNLLASSQGTAGKYEWLVNSKSVGSVSSGYSIPERISGNATFAMLSKTEYGARYLEFILPYLNGPVYTVAGDTLP